MAISATSEGAEVFFSLRSPLSPETQTLNFDVPAGAQLVETSAGSFEVVDGETVIARIPAPVAFDSDGTSIPVEASADGEALTLSTEHRGQDLAYPILVDPIIDTIATAAPAVRRFSEAVDSEGNLIAPYGGWYAVDDGGSLDNYAASGAFGDGLYLEDPVATTPHGGVWIWIAPPGSAELTQVDFGPYGLALNGDTSSAGGGMILGTATGEGLAGELHTADVSNGYTTIYSAEAEGDPSPVDFALFGLLRIKFGSTVGDNDHSAYLGGAVARLGDSAGATLTGDLGEMGTETIDAGWTNSSDTMTIPMEATDSGLGVKKLEALAVDENDETVVLGSYVDPCLGGAASPCPETLAHDVDLDMSLIDEGRYTIKFRAYDALLQTGGGPNLKVGVDRSRPVLNEIGGSILTDSPSSPPRPQYSVGLDALDEQAGIDSIENRIEGVLVDTLQTDCATDGCPLNWEWTLQADELPNGTYTLSSMAIDRAGNQSETRDTTFTIRPDLTPPEISVSGPLHDAPDGWINQEMYDLRIEANDQGFGVTSVQLLVDGEPVPSSLDTPIDRPCPTGGCEIRTDAVADMTPYDGGKHEVSIVAEDAAGNSSVKAWSVNVNPTGPNVTNNEIVQTLRAYEPTSGASVVGPPDFDPEYPGATENVGFVPSGDDVEIVGGVVPTEVLTDEALQVIATIPSESPGEAEQLPPTPAGDILGSDVSLVNEESPASETDVEVRNFEVVSTNSTNDTDTIVRSLYDGAIMFKVIRDEILLTSYLWRVDHDEGQILFQAPNDEQTVQLTYSDGTPALTIGAQPAYDATGAVVETSLVLEGDDVVTLEVEHRNQGVTYPVVAGPGWQAASVTSTVTTQSMVDASVPRVETVLAATNLSRSPGGIEDVPLPRDTGSLASTGGEVFGSDFMSAPEPDREDAAWASNRCNSRPSRQCVTKRRYAFVRCIKDSPDPGGPRPRSGLGLCRNSLYETVTFGMVVFGQFRYRYGDWVRVKPGDYHTKIYGLDQGDGSRGPLPPGNYSANAPAYMAFLPKKLHVYGTFVWNGSYRHCWKLRGYLPSRPPDSGSFPVKEIDPMLRFSDAVSWRSYGGAMVFGTYEQLCGPFSYTLNEDG